MLKPFLLIFRIAICFILIQIIGKIIFVIYHFDKFKTLNFSDKIGIFSHGIKLDLSISAYLLIIPFLVNFILITIKKAKIPFIIFLKYYTLTFCIIISCIITVDLELYRNWGSKIDNSIFKYFANPTEMMASSAASPFYLLVPILFFLLCISYLFINQCFKKQYDFNIKNRILSFAFNLLLLASLIIPIRGGFQLSPINQSTAYFSSTNFANHAAINPVFNLFYSIVNKGSNENPFLYLNPKVAKAKVDSLFFSTELTDYQINTSKPNVLIITWESFTSKALHNTAEGIEVLPNFKKLINEGLFFNNCYASGDRSEKGLIAILSGYPAQPTTSIMTIPEKAVKLPILSKDFKKNGYKTAWYYGGEPEFANIKSYILNGQFDQLITKENFPKAYTENTKWGANDKVVFEILADDLNKIQQPFFVNYFTLSSHEPYEIPDHQAIKGKDETHKFLNAHHFTDEQLGNFIEKAKKQAWYKNTLIVIIADHGHRIPDTNSKLDEFHIPMLWLGGALNVPAKTISDVCSQNDIAKTLLNQLKINSKEYVWSKDLFVKNYKPFAYFSFNNGFGFVQNGKSFSLDNIGKQIITSNGPVNAADINLGKAYVQTSFADYLSK